MVLDNASQDLAQLQEEFRLAVEQNIKREGIYSLIKMLDNSDFLIAPASSKYHGNHPGGLIAHSLAVWKELQRLSGIYGYHYSPETLAICGLLHDICKMNMYTIDYRNVKNEAGVWERVPYYKHDEQFVYGGNGAKSVYLIMQHMQLTPEEATAIHNHMGAWDLSNYNQPGKVYDENPLAWLLHVADEAAAHIYKI